MHQRSNLALALLIAAAPIGCADDNPSAPALTNSAPNGPNAKATNFHAALEDIRTRVLPTFAADAEPERILSILNDLETSLGSRDPQALRKAVTRSDKLLEDLQNNGDQALAADLAAIALIVEHARMQLETTREIQ
jgi:hypothetical protein